MIKVFFDNQIFSAQKFGGISRYIVELRNRLPDYGVQVNRTRVFSENVYLDTKYSVSSDLNIPFKTSLIRRVNDLIDFADFTSGKYDIFHPTYYHPSKYLQNVNAKKVITVHDMIHEIFREEIAESSIVIGAKKDVIRSADHIIAISECTKKDLVNYLNVSPQKISVVYHGGPSAHVGARHKKLPENYILYVGARSGYKSFDRFIKSSAETLKKNNISLFCAGGGEFTSSEKHLIQELGLSGILFQQNVSDEELSYCYKHAKLFVFPSVYEGFGLPILEAFSVNCPVVLYNGSCFPEIAQDGAHYFDSFGDLPDLLSKMLCENSFRTSKVSMQNLRLEDFSWRKTAHETSEVYRKIL